MKAPAATLKEPSLKPQSEEAVDAGGAPLPSWLADLQIEAPAAMLKRTSLEPQMEEVVDLEAAGLADRGPDPLGLGTWLQTTAERATAGAVTGSPRGSVATCQTDLSEDPAAGLDVTRLPEALLAAVAAATGTLSAKEVTLRLPAAAMASPAAVLQPVGLAIAPPAVQASHAGAAPEGGDLELSATGAFGSAADPADLLELSDTGASKLEQADALWFHPSLRGPTLAKAAAGEAVN